ncbi:MAG: phosphatidate cytidylyltransferase [Burkholderia sp.]|nr:phosphatidate cytidylyltransferase [Burkholderia sp.]
MLKIRIFTTFVLLSILLTATLLGPFSVFSALITLIVAFAAFEWARLLKFGYLICPIMYAAIVVIILSLSKQFGIKFNMSYHPLFIAASIFWVTISPFALWRKPKLTCGTWKLFLLVVGAILLTACWHAIIIARLFGSTFVLSIFSVVWMADIGAYFSGKIFGKHKLALSISPGKTWEGVAGGFLTVIIFSYIAIYTHLFEPTLFSILALRYQISGALAALIFLVIFSIVGDLFESLLKRQVGFKDSSNLLPGHGGMLDRIDSLLPILPLVMLIL